jgi:hypothetical protein
MIAIVAPTGGNVPISTSTDLTSTLAEVQSCNRPRDALCNLHLLMQFLCRVDQFSDSTSSTKY